MLFIVISPSDSRENERPRASAWENRFALGGIDRVTGLGAQCHIENSAEARQLLWPRQHTQQMALLAPHATP
jgi:hypothetical protein